jgi:hypothetical protein
MTTIQTIELSENERQVVQDFLELTDKMSEVVKCSMCDVFEYLVNEAEIDERGNYKIKSLHYIGEIG